MHAVTTFLRALAASSLLSSFLLLLLPAHLARAQQSGGPTATTTITETSTVLTLTITVTPDHSTFVGVVTTDTTSVFTLETGSTSASAVVTTTSTGTSATAIGTMAYTGTAFGSAVLNSTNYFRAQHQASALTWNTTLAQYAQDYAQKCLWQHSVGFHFIYPLMPPRESGDRQRHHTA